jgi:hypothetical protein
VAGRGDGVRWTAAGMEVAASKFRRIKGYRELPILIEQLAGIAEHSLRRVVRLRNQTVGSPRKFHCDRDILSDSPNHFRPLPLQKPPWCYAVIGVIVETGTCPLEAAPPG